MKQCDSEKVLCLSCVLEWSPRIKSFEMGQLQSHMRSRKARNNERKKQKSLNAADDNEENRSINSDPKEPWSPSNREKRKLNFLSKLSPRPKIKNKNRKNKSNSNDIEENNKKISSSDSLNNVEDSKTNKQSLDSQADSAIHLDTQSDSAIIVADEGNGVIDKEEPEAEIKEVHNTPVPVIISEGVSDDESTHKQEPIEGGQSDTGFSDMSGMGHSPISGDTELSWAQGDHFLPIPPQSNRRSSASSTTSTSSDEELPLRSLVASMNGRPKSRSWGLIKQVVHWSPFVQVYKKKYPWVQLAGHSGAFKPGENGTILKKLTPKEFSCLVRLKGDPMVDITPTFHGEVEKEGQKYVQLQDLLAEFENPSVCDIKMGSRTYLEEELTKAREKKTFRKDMYEKMVKVDRNEPTEEENRLKAVTKPRYMQWREQLSSTATLGFRIDGIKQADRDPDKNFKTVRTREEVAYVLRKHIDCEDSTRRKLIERLKVVRDTLEGSMFFKTHEVIGSSLLFVHDKPLNGEARCNIWLIDFGKTTPLAEGKLLDHRTPWTEGNQEDGYLWGLDNLLELLENLFEIKCPEGLEDTSG